MSLNCYLGLRIVACNLDGEKILLCCDLKVRMMMDSGKEPSANEGIELRSGVAPGNLDALSILAMLYPLHSDAVSHILRRETSRAGSAHGRIFLRRMRQMPAIPIPRMRFGRNGLGKSLWR